MDETIASDADILRAAGPELVHERLCALVAAGRVSFSRAHEAYHELMLAASGDVTDEPRGSPTQTAPLLRRE
jgi:hypothetical protein